MISGYVQSASQNVSDGDKVTAFRLVDVNEGTRFRLFGIHFIPASTGTAGDTVGIELYDGDPDSGGSVFFKDVIYSVSSTSAGYISYNNLRMIGISSHGILASGVSDIYAKGLEDGINFVSVTYQIG